MALKLTRSFGAWIELRDDRSGAVTRFRAVSTEDTTKVQFQIEAPVFVAIDRVGPPGQAVTPPKVVRDA